MNVYRIDPLGDPRWADFVAASPRASIFHTPGWLRALQRTYRYVPVAYTTSPPGTALTNGLAACEIQSWLTGRRLVSMPFADHCEPLVGDGGECGAILQALASEVRAGRWKYVEVRPLTPRSDAAPGMASSATFCFHALDLRPALDALFRACHKDSIQRKIRRAEREGLRVETGTAEDLLTAFYDLLLLTRRRHHLPPQPIDWFRNLIACLPGRVTISVAFGGARPLASIVTLQHGDTLVYKYGASDARLHNLGGMPFLFWSAITEAKAKGITLLDLGRTDLDQSGLIAFKDRLGARRSTLTYFRCSAQEATGTGGRTATRAAGMLLSRLPRPLVRAAGRILYRHAG